MLVYQRVPGLVNIQKAIENGHRNRLIVDLAIKTYVIFHGFFVCLPEGTLLFPAGITGNSVDWGVFLSFTGQKSNTRIDQDFDLVPRLRSARTSSSLSSKPSFGRLKLKAWLGQCGNVWKCVEPKKGTKNIRESPFWEWDKRSSERFPRITKTSQGITRPKANYFFNLYCSWFGAKCSRRAKERGWLVWARDVDRQERPLC